MKVVSLSLLSLIHVDSFAVHKRSCPSEPIESPLSEVSRRNWLASTAANIIGTSLFFLAAALEPQPANAVVMEQRDTDVFVAGQSISVEDAKKRFKMAQESLDYLLTNYDGIVNAGGGDNVRRYLGTVGTTSGLYGITKVLKVLQDEASDIVEYTENMNDFDAFLRGADTAVYSANFVEFSAAKTKPEKFFDDALKDARKMKIAMDNMAKELF